MIWLAKFRLRLGAWLRRGSLDVEMEAEMKAHLDLRTEANIAAGMNNEVARLAALRQFGWADTIKQTCREQRGLLWMDHLAQDTNLAFRQLGKNPGFVAVALLTLALGIGANTAWFSAVEALLNPLLPYPDSGRLVAVFRTSPHSQRWPHSPANFLDQRDQNQQFEEMAALATTPVNLAAPAEPAERVNEMRSSAAIFPILRIQPILGRAFTAADDQPGRQDVIVLSHPFWLRHFGGDPGVIGRKLRLDGEPVTVIGVMPEQFYPTRIWGPADFWRPIAFSAEHRQDRGGNYLQVVARLKEGVTISQAQAGMEVLAARLVKEHPENNPAEGLRVVPLAEAGLDQNARMILRLTLVLAGFVLLIACSNLANVQTARTLARQHELAIRGALGAARGRLVRQLLTESLIIAFFGGVLGLILAGWSNALLTDWISAQMGFPLSINLNLRGFAYATVVAAGSGLAFGLLPACLASRVEVNQSLKKGMRGATEDRSRHRLQNSLVVTQVAFALVLLAGACFLVSGLRQFVALDPGWKVDGLTVGFFSLPDTKYRSEPARSDFADRIRSRVQTIPNVESVALARSLPISAFSVAGGFDIEGRPAWTKGHEPLVYVTSVTPGYFETMKTRVVAGRDFNNSDNADHPQVVMINESMARAFWPGVSPVGQRIGEAGHWQEIVGVAADVAYPSDPSEPMTRFQTYRPFAQDAKSPLAIVIRGDVSAKTLQSALTELDPDQAIKGISSARAAVGRSLGNFDLLGWILGGFAALGLLLAVLGVYAVMAGSVVRRSNEIGVRMALGARIHQVVWLVLGKGLKLTLVGALVGLAGAGAVTRLLSSLLPLMQVSITAVLVAVVLLLLGITFPACWLPARRAAKVDPASALRSE